MGNAIGVPRKYMYIDDICHCCLSGKTTTDAGRIGIEVIIGVL